tara:strand:- start:722 stop:1102 length:381 start_codon:yes stop_codon:yes gene_type:complete
MARHYIKEQINELIDNCMKNEEPTDICRFWYFADEGISVLDKDEMKEQFIDYKNKGTLKIEDFNNQMIKRNGRKFYVLVVQHKDEDKNPNCPMSLLGYGFMVSGFPYWFDKKKDRDNAVKIFKGEM